MASEWYLINKPTYNSGFEGEEFNAYKNDGLEEILGEDSPISSSVSLINADLSEILNFRAIVQNNTSDSKTNTTDRQVITNIGTLKCGDYLLYDDNVYMVISFVGNNTIYEKAIVEICNYTLKFQSPTGIILSYPCITDNRVQGTGDIDTKVMTLPAGRKIILLPHDEHTTLLRNDRRLFVDLHPTDPRPYTIDFVDSTKFNYGDKGLLEIYVTEDQLQSDDRVDLGVCNYFEPSGEVEVPAEGYSITITSSGDLITGSQTPRTFIPTLIDNTGTVVEFATTPIWTFDYSTMSPNDFTVTYNGNNCLVKVKENYDYLGMTLRVICTTNDGLYSGYTDVLITI